MLHALWKQPLAFWAVCMLLFVQALAVLDPVQLRLQYDEQLKDQARYVYTSRIPMAAGQSADQYTDGQLVHIAQQAYTIMQVDNAVGKKKRPGAMTVMAKGDSVYVISSLKNGAFIYNPGVAVPEVAEALAACSARHHETPHRLGGACGEPLCAQAFFSDHPELALADLNGARVVTWGKTNEGEKIMVPCGNDPDQPPDTWGCHQFVQQIGLVPIAATTEPDPNTILPIGEHPVRPCLQ